MALVSTAAGAVVFGTGQDQFVIILGPDCTFQMIGETGPSGAAVILLLAGEQRQETRGTDVGAFPFFVVERARE